MPILFYTTLLVTHSVHFAKLKSRQLQIYSKSPNISVANICCYTVRSFSYCWQYRVYLSLSAKHNWYSNILYSSYWYAVNGSSISPINCILYHTGKDDINSVDKYIRWNNLTMIANWGTDYARRTFGYESRLKPRLKKDEVLVIFLEEAFR